MRLGSNPLKTATLPPLARVVVLVITHLPEMESDYHKDRFRVVMASINSIITNTEGEYDLVIWDNGSCNYFTQGLQDWKEAGIYSAVILSRNIGKTNALKSVMRMLPAGTILAYGDDDIEYFPNWLAPQIEILETYPNVGTVTGWPVRITGSWGEDSVHKFVFGTRKLHGHDVTYEKGHIIPEEWEKDYCNSVGRDWDRYKTVTWGVLDYLVTYRGVQAYAMSQHAQFVCYPERVEPLIPWTDKAMQSEIEFDKAVDAAGLLRLATVERYTRHIGNVLEERA